MTALAKPISEERKTRPNVTEVINLPKLLWARGNFHFRLQSGQLFPERKRGLPLSGPSDSQVANSGRRSEAKAEGKLRFSVTTTLTVARWLERDGSFLWRIPANPPFFEPNKLCCRPATRSSYENFRGDERGRRQESCLCRRRHSCAWRPVGMEPHPRGVVDRREEKSAKEVQANPG